MTKQIPNVILAYLAPYFLARQVRKGFIAIGEHWTKLRRLGEYVLHHIRTTMSIIVPRVGKIRFFPQFPQYFHQFLIFDKIQRLDEIPPPLLRQPMFVVLARPFHLLQFLVVFDAVFHEDVIHRKKPVLQTFQRTINDLLRQQGHQAFESIA